MPTMKLPLILLTAILTLCIAGCNSRNPQKEAITIHQSLNQLKPLIFDNPKAGYHKLDSLQRTASDSALWYEIELFKGACLLQSGQQAEGYKTYGRVKQWCNLNTGNYRLEGIVYNTLGIDKALSGNIDMAGKFYQRSFDCLSRVPKDEQFISTCINLADHYMISGRLPEAAGVYRYALYVCDSINYTPSRTPIYSGLATVYMELENFKMAHEFLDMAARDIDQCELTTRLFYYTTCGNCSYYEENYQQSLQYFFKAFELAKAFNNNYNIILCHGNMAENYLMLDSLEQAEIHLEACKDYLQTNSHKHPQMTYYIESLLLDLAIAQKKPDQIRRYYRQNVDSILKDFPRYLMLHYRRLERYTAANGLWQKAYHNLEKSTHYANRLRSQHIQNNVIEMEQRYRRDTTLLQQQVALANYRTQSIQQQNYIILAVAAALVLLLLSAITFIYLRRRNAQRLKQQMEKMTELRMDIVRNRVSPHYIFNVLGTILPKLQRYPEMLQPVEMLIDVLRGNLLASGKVAVMLRDELALVERFVELYHYSKGERPRVIWHIDNELKQSTLQIPSMSLQIPVENALKHAFPVLTETSKININIYIENHLLHLCVTDNGCGYNPGKVKVTGRDTGTGLRLLTRTIAILNQYNEQQATIEIANLPAPQQGTRIELVLPENYSFTLPDAGY